MRRISIFMLLLFFLVGSTHCQTGEKKELGAASSAEASPSEPSGVEGGEGPVGDSRDAGPKGVPKILFDGEEFDFGEVEAGEEVEHVFAFRNGGDGLLRIHKVRTSCGCTGALVSSQEIPPGETGAIKATLRSNGFQGRVKKTLTVESNDPENRFVRLAVEGKVVSEVMVDPRFVDWGTINRETPPGPKRLRIRFREGKGIEIQEVRAESESVILEKEEENEEGAVYRVSLSNTLPKGRLVGSIFVRTNSEKVPEVQVPFHALIEGDVKASPSLLSFASVRPGQSLSRHLTLEKTGGEDFSVERVKATTGAIVTEFERGKKGSRIRLKVTFDPGTRTEGRIVERLTIFLENREEEIIEVPVYGNIQKDEKETHS